MQNILLLITVPCSRRFCGLKRVNPLVGTLKPQSNEYSNTMIGTLAIDRWAWASCSSAQSPPRCTKCNSPPINGQCTNFILFDVTL